MSVKTPLTVNRHRDADEYAAMLRRMLRAFGRRVAAGDPDDLAELVALRETLEQAISEAVAGQRETHGYSWGDLAASLGTSRQAVHQRYGRATANG